MNNMTNVNQERKFIVYKHTNIANEKVYIGITGSKAQKRWGANGINYKQNRHFYGAIKKYGWKQGFRHEILFSGLTKSEACQKEQELIKFYNSNDDRFGYNHSTGGEIPATGCTRVQTQETIEKIRAKTSISIICINNNKIYKSSREAGKELNLDYRYISRVLNGQALTCHGYYFVFLKDYDSNKCYEIYQNKKPIICLETGEIFNSVSECAKKIQHK